MNVDTMDAQDDILAVIIKREKKTVMIVIALLEFRFSFISTAFAQKESILKRASGTGLLVGLFASRRSYMLLA